MTPNGLPIHREVIASRPPERGHERAFARAIGLHLAQYRHEHGLTLDEMARATGMRRWVVILVESGQVRPSLATLAKITAVTSLRFHLDIGNGEVVLTG